MKDEQLIILKNPNGVCEYDWDIYKECKTLLLKPIEGEVYEIISEHSTPAEALIERTSINKENYKIHMTKPGEKIIPYEQAFELYKLGFDEMKNELLKLSMENLDLRFQISNLKTDNEWLKKVKENYEVILNKKIDTANLFLNSLESKNKEIETLTQEVERLKKKVTALKDALNPF